MTPLARIAEGDSDAGRSGAGGSPDPVHITFGYIRQFVVDDMGHVIDVDAARGDIGRHQYACAAFTEIVERALACALRLVAMDCLGADSIALKMFHHLVGAMLGPRENHHPVKVRLGEQLGQRCALCLRIKMVDALVYTLDSDAFGRDLDAFGRFFRAALSGGVYLPPSQFEAAFLSHALSDAQVEQIADGLNAALLAAYQH